MAGAKVVIATLALFFVAYGQSSTIKDFPSNDLPGLALPIDDWELEEEVAAPCCFPNQWQANLTAQMGVSGGGRGDDEDRGGRGGGGAKFRSSTVGIFIDSTAKKVAMQVQNATRSRNQTLTIIVVFGSGATGAELYIVNFAKQNCTHKTLANATFRSQCIPANATLSGSFNLGGASGGLQVDQWKFCGKSNDTRGKARAFVRGTILVQTGCVPVLIQDHGLIRRRPHDDDEDVEFDEMEMDVVDKKGRHGQGKGFVASTFFQNVKTTFDNPNIFDVPSFCPKAGLGNGLVFDPEDVPDAMVRFVSY